MENIIILISGIMLKAKNMIVINGFRLAQLDSKLSMFSGLLDSKQL
jgi:hypothetical protein